MVSSSPVPLVGMSPAHVSNPKAGSILHGNYIIHADRSLLYRKCRNIGGQKIWQLCLKVVILSNIGEFKFGSLVMANCDDVMHMHT